MYKSDGEKKMKWQNQQEKFYMHILAPSGQAGRLTASVSNQS
jgi:hypothetical protein